MSYPTIGRTIFYWPPGDPEPLAAHVAGVDPSKTDGCHLHLVVLDPMAGVRVVRGVQGNNEGRGPGQWHWPPRSPIVAGDDPGVAQLDAIATRFENLIKRAEELGDEAEAALPAPRKTLDEVTREEIARGDYDLPADPPPPERPEGEEQPA